MDRLRPVKKSKKRHYNFKERLAFFLDNGYLHGLRYLGERCGVYGKIFWLAIMITSAWQMSRIFIMTFKAFENDATSINVNSAYLHWNNTFPAVSVCITKGRSTAAIRQFLNEFWAANNIKPPKKVMGYIKLLQSYLFQSPNQPIESFDPYCADENTTCGINLVVLRDLFFPKSCREFMLNVTFLGQPYNDCEDLFKLIETEMGYCFSANSLYTFDLDTKKLPLKYNRENFDRTLSFAYRDMDTILFTLYVHSPEDLPYFNAFSYNLRKSDSHVEYLFHTIEMHNDLDVHDLKYEKRRCRFPNEYIDRIQMPYSFSTCFLDLRIRAELEKCNCTIHTSPKIFENKFCDYEGLKCIREAEINLMAKEMHYRKETQCMQSCIEMDIATVGEIETILEQNGDPASLTIELINNPTTRFVRSVARTNLDLVVTIGGVFGLFFGASILTIFQFFYIWFIRKF